MLKLEQESEVEESQKLLDGCSPKELQSKGVALLGLTIYSRKTGESTDLCKFRAYQRKCRQRKILSSRTQRFNLTFSGQGITLLGAVVRAQICTDLTDFGVNR